MRDYSKIKDSKPRKGPDRLGKSADKGCIGRRWLWVARVAALINYVDAASGRVRLHYYATREYPEGMTIDPPQAQGVDRHGRLWAYASSGTLWPDRWPKSALSRRLDVYRAYGRTVPFFSPAHGHKIPGPKPPKAPTLKFSRNAPYAPIANAWPEILRSLKGGAA